MTARTKHTLVVAALLLAPNLLGFLTFTAGPVLFSLVMAFTNWDLTVHNDLSTTPIRYVGLANFAALFVGHEQRLFFTYLYNTVYLMLGIPVGIALSLAAALLLEKPLVAPRGTPSTRLVAVTAGVTLAAALVLALLRLSPVAISLTLVTGGIVVLGQLCGTTSYRTIFYLPNLTAGVAMFILWKALYRPDTGPINSALQPLLDGLAALVRHSPALLWRGLGMLVIGVALAGGAWALWRLAVLVRERELSLLGGGALLALAGAGVAALWGLGQVLAGLPQAVAATGLLAPAWLTSPQWSKPALMFMGICMAMGSNNMLLYLAALTNVPPSLREAASVDGATPWQIFAHVTWPQLAPTTFFIIVMSTIGGLQGGFEQAQAMTGGGPAGSTTTLSFFLYQRGFQDFQFGIASAIAWTMFLLILVLTLINWRFGNRMMND